MDSMSGDADRLERTLELFGPINRWLTPCRRLIRRNILPSIRRQPDRTWQYLDIGAGGGDLAIWLARQCQKLGYSIEITCLDYDPRAVRFAELSCRDFPNISIQQADARQLESLSRHWDFTFCNHFLHHLENAEIVQVLKSIHAVTEHRYVLNDIHRTRGTYLAYSALSPLCFRGSFAWHDGRLSIRKGFRIKELHELLEQAEIGGHASVSRHLPGHLAIVSDIRLENHRENS